METEGVFGHKQNLLKCLDSMYWKYNVKNIIWMSIS